MLSMQINLTKTYILFHKKDLSLGDTEKVPKVRGSNPLSPPFSKVPFPQNGNYYANLIFTRRIFEPLDFTVVIDGLITLQHDWNPPFLEPGNCFSEIKVTG